MIRKRNATARLEVFVVAVKQSFNHPFQVKFEKYFQRTYSDEN
jgi:hypothetical protein